ncbi:protein arginine methyltransferase NDUFAF7 homolog, mitochondrial [Topomyia yanbarensis]|uniref:protein arginine methyltransferase NDUFAF7 homolog, mitochondrial n=1 Tax=Topomyia yanbarensis TaxID=2498891 RepID=UPI00273BE75C|nr:protein arginine methyltransferase NDUFAF7 homolog, mitochondrial [Topomyia yanbarensis]
MNVRIAGVFFQQFRSYSYKPVKRVPLPPASKLEVPESTSTKNFSLREELKSRILASGPIPVASYMRQVLTNPAAGYYMTSEDVLGSKGDFVTSPEIGQIFGELVGAWCLNEWYKFGSPVPYQLVELGPGKGTMMSDILRVVGNLKATGGLSVHLVEISEHLSKVQASLLCRGCTDHKDEPFYRSGVTSSGTKVYWYRHLEDVPRVFSIILAHEFFDALPIHKFQKESDGWKEVLVDIDPNSNDKFRFVVSKAETPMLRLFLNSLPEIANGREHVEISFESEALIRQIGERFHSNGGLALIVDYGHLGEKGDTFRAFKRHKLHDPLVDPGSADLTADVDFSILNQFCERTSQVFTIGPTSQRSFLEMAGAKDRLAVLLERAKSEEEKRRLTDGFRILTEENQMGSRFKFFGLYPKELRESYLGLK